jgi:5-methylcytosine-specific restriction endonuclease McrBC GTP-binding regulatory subunit McrB
MSTADKSLALMDSVLRRRFKFIEYKPQYELVDDEDLRAVMQRLNDSLRKSFENTDFLIGHAYFMDKSIEDLASIMNDNIVPLLYEYFYEDSKKTLMTLKEALRDTMYRLEHSVSGRISVI